MATLSEVAHEWFTAASLGDLLEELTLRNAAGAEKRNIALSREDYAKQKRFSPEFVRLLSETTSRSFHSWIRARAENTFGLFEEDLDQVLQLKRQQAELAGYEAYPYDALADEFKGLHRRPLG